MPRVRDVFEVPMSYIEFLGLVALGCAVSGIAWTLVADWWDRKHHYEEEP